jgi:hypothetical protein
MKKKSRAKTVFCKGDIVRLFVGMTVDGWQWRERIDAQKGHVHVPPKIPYARSSCGEIWFRGRELWIGKEPGDCLTAKWAKDNLLWVNPVIEHFSQMAGRHLLRESKWAHAYRGSNPSYSLPPSDHVIVMTPRIPSAASHKFNLNWLLEKVMDPAILRGHDRSANMYMMSGRQRLADLQSYARRFNLAIPRQDELDAYTDKCKTKEILGKMTT